MFVHGCLQGRWTLSASAQIHIMGDVIQSNIESSRCLDMRTPQRNSEVLRSVLVHKPTCCMASHELYRGVKVKRSNKEAIAVWWKVRSIGSRLSEGCSENIIVMRRTKSGWLLESSCSRSCPVAAFDDMWGLLLSIACKNQFWIYIIRKP